jgi:predicted CXXCH cytochrome family protein
VRRLTLLLAGGAVWLFLAAIPVFADGGPHVASINSGAGGINADSCAGCHRAHTAQGPLLLIDSQPAMCLACHGTAGTGATTDVENGVQYNLTGSPVRGTAVVGALRDGGFIQARIGSGSAARWSYTSGTAVRASGFVPAASTGQNVTSAHMTLVGGEVEAKTGITWGNGPISATANLGATTTVECTTCHNPHGNGQYRILNPVPVPAAVTGGGTFVATTGQALVTDAVLPPAGDTRNYTIHQVAGPTYWLNLSQVTGTTAASGDYFHRTVPWNAGFLGVTAQNDAPNGLPTTFNAQMNAWCSTCHTRIMATQGTPYQTDSGDAVFKYRHSNTSNKPCTTCHVAHGSNAQMTGTYSSNFDVSPVIASNTGSDSLLLKVDNRGTCQVCHDPTGTITAGTKIGPTPVAP